MGEEFIQYGHLANGSVYASANFDTPSYESNLLEGLASGDVEDIVSQSLTRHIQTASPREPSAHNWRRSLRDLMLAQTESVLNSCFNDFHAIIVTLVCVIGTVSHPKQLSVFLGNFITGVIDR